MSAIVTAPPGGAADIDLAESVAGEEDPGASIDVPTDKDVCPDCSGSGQLAGRECPQCQGTGKVASR